MAACASCRQRIADVLGDTGTVVDLTQLLGRDATNELLIPRSIQSGTPAY